MGSLVGHAIYYCCVWNGRKKVHLHTNGDRELEISADLCLENLPAFHRWYFHTVKGRTYGFVMEEGITYFAIADPNISNSCILSFLQHVRDAYKFSRNSIQEELVPVVQRLVASLESLSQQSGIAQVTEVPSAHQGRTSEMPLLGRRSGKLDDDETHFNEGINPDVSPPMIGGFSLQKSLSSNRSRNQLISRSLWLRQVKIVAAVDVLVCLVLFGIWLAICDGFTCVG